MDAKLKSEIQNLFRDWGRLVQAESDAISRADWSLARDCQEAMARLRPRLEGLREQVHGPAGDATTSAGDLGAFLFTNIGEMIESERRNLAGLMERQRKLQESLDQAEQSRRLLRRIRHSYRIRREAVSPGTSQPSFEAAGGAVPPERGSSTFASLA